jgi:hypothetical protein
MKRNRVWQVGLLTVVGLAAPLLSGCQTNVAGMTLPSGYYLEHPPQYFPPSPSFPFARELASMEAQANQANQAEQGGRGLPERIPGGAGR